MNLIEAWFDGVCEPVNPGGHAAWGAQVVVSGIVTLQTSGYVGRGDAMSNNVAEYAGFIACAEEILKHAGPARIRGDSKLVVNQLNGLWKVNGGRYFPFYERAVPLWRQLKHRTQLVWIPREQNDVCDELSKQELRDRGVRFRIQPEHKKHVASGFESDDHRDYSSY